MPPCALVIRRSTTSQARQAGNGVRRERPAHHASCWTISSSERKDRISTRGRRGGSGIEPRDSDTRVLLHRPLTSPPVSGWQTGAACGSSFRPRPRRVPPPGPLPPHLPEPPPPARSSYGAPSRPRPLRATPRDRCCRAAANGTPARREIRGVASLPKPPCRREVGLVRLSNWFRRWRGRGFPQPGPALPANAECLHLRLRLLLRLRSSSRLPQRSCEIEGASRVFCVLCSRAP